MKFAYLKAFSAILLSVSFCIAHAQTSCPGFPSMVESKKTNINIGTYIKGYLEYLPPDYNPGDPNTRHPVILYFHGAGEVGAGSSSDLCALLTLLTPPTGNNPGDVPLPERVENGQVPSVTNNGTTYSYIILSPQYNQYNYPSAYPSAADVSAMIDYALLNYPKIDPGRIYITGMSSGANMVMEYAATSVANARRIAGVVMASLCSSVGSYPNGPANIANAHLPVWEIHCATDGVCPDSISTNWVNKINALSPGLALKTTLPITGYPCNGGFTHNTWNTVYDPAFVVDGRNVYNWFIQYTRLGPGALPAGIKNYTAVLRGGKVYVEWTTTAESNTDRFILERTNGNAPYQQVASVIAAGSSNTDKKYVLIDEQPGKGNNLYRLVLLNKDNQREYFDVKRVSLPNSGGNVNIPSPVKGSLLMYVNVERAQNVRISMHDLNGKTLYRNNKLFTPGISENRVDVTGFAAGTYFVKVEGENFSVTRKIVVN